MTSLMTSIEIGLWNALLPIRNRILLHSEQDNEILLSSDNSYQEHSEYTPVIENILITDNPLESDNQILHLSEWVNGATVISRLSTKNYLKVQIILMSIISILGVTIGLLVSFFLI